MKTNIEIAQEAQGSRIGDIAAKVGIDEADLVPFGRYAAKVPSDRPPPLR